MAGVGALWPKAEGQPVDAGAQIPAIRRRQFVTFDKPQEQYRSNERAKAWNGGVW
jgi:hypothetical protein